MTYYWIKLYHEILHDPKMGRLPDRVWRRCIELFLIAGENNKLGELPSVDDIAWTLRVDITELKQDLQELIEAGILHSEDGVTHFVTHFAERQDADTPKERVARYRERERKINADVTQPLRNVTQTVTNHVPDIDIDIDKEVNAAKTAAKAPKPPKTPKPQDVSYIRLQEKFISITGLPVPKPNSERDWREFHALWMDPGKSILSWVDYDENKAAILVEDAVKRMQKDNLTIANFKSIVKVASAAYGDRNGHN